MRLGFGRVDGLVHGLRADKWQSQITNASLFVSVWEAQEPQGHWRKGLSVLRPDVWARRVCVCPATTGDKGIMTQATERS